MPFDDAGVGLVGPVRRTGNSNARPIRTKIGKTAKLPDEAAQRAALVAH